MLESGETPKELFPSLELMKLLIRNGGQGEKFPTSWWFEKQEAPFQLFFKPMEFILRVPEWWIDGEEEGPEAFSMNKAQVI